MRLVTGCIRPTPTHWLPALSNIAPPHLRREQCLIRELDKICKDPTLPINNDIPNTNTKRLKSRSPPLAKMNTKSPSWNCQNAWLDEWSTKEVSPDIFELEPKKKPPGFSEQRRAWCLVNRFRANVGNAAYYRSKWGWCESAACECGYPEQTIHHMVLDCPLTKFDGDPDDLKHLTEKAMDYFKKSKFKY